MAQPLCLCGRPVADAFLCQRCVTVLCADLRSVPSLVDELHVTMSRRARMTGDPVGYIRRTPDRPMPPHWGAANALADLKATLTIWVRTVAEQRAAAVDAQDTSSSLARWLIRHRESVRQCDEATELHARVTDVIGTGWHVVDRPPALVYAGPCDYCRGDLYGMAGAALVRCPVCRVDYPIPERREWLLSAAMDERRTAAEIARALPNLLNIPLTRAMVQGYIYRGDVPSSLDADGHRRARVGDIVELLARVTSSAHS